MAKDKKVVPGPGNPDGPVAEKKPEVTPDAPAPKAAPKGGEAPPPEVTREFVIDRFQCAALKAGQDNKNRAEGEFRAAATEFADLVEAVVESINERLKLDPELKVEQVRHLNVKKGLIRIAIPKDEKPAKAKK